MDNKQQLQEGLQSMGLSLTTAQQLLLLEYVALLKKWNSTYNLTALRDEHTMISHHVLDSLTLLPYIQHAQTLMDVGSGGRRIECCQCALCVAIIGYGVCRHHAR